MATNNKGRRVTMPTTPGIQEDTQNLAEDMEASVSEASTYALQVGLGVNNLRERGDVVFRPSDGGTEQLIADSNGIFSYDRHRKK